MSAGIKNILFFFLSLLCSWGLNAAGLKLLHFSGLHPAYALGACVIAGLFYLPRPSFWPGYLLYFVLSFLCTLGIFFGYAQIIGILGLLYFIAFSLVKGVRK